MIRRAVAAPETVPPSTSGTPSLRHWYVRAPWPEAATPRIAADPTMADPSATIGAR